jgi:pantoate--beta-alanine ligase
LAKAGPIVLEKIETVAALRERLAEISPASPKHEVRRRGLVPTMGALHAGHAALVDMARRECGVVVVSIFVNPLQFNSQDDLARYPRTLDADVELCRKLGVDVVFAPSAAEVYPEPPECSVDVGRLADHLCGRFRPGHFRGVATVVLKLFQMVQPHRAYFGEKDAQQLAIVTRLASDFNLPIEVVGVPTVREADGLAMSSRNRHLSAVERSLAPSLYRALEEARRRILAGRGPQRGSRGGVPERSAPAIAHAAAATIPQSDTLRLEYLEIVDPATMQPVDDISAAVRVAGALWVGSTRLIDNVLV